MDRQAASGFEEQKASAEVPVCAAGFSEAACADIRIGMVGAGRVARRFVAESQAVDGVDIVGVLSTNEDSTQAFLDGVLGVQDSKKPGGEQPPLVSNCMDELFAVSDAIYIASPHQYHYEQAKAALCAGKHVLCEKPLAFSGEQALELFELADKNGLVLLEDVKTAFFPGFEKLVSTVKSGVIGEVRDVEASFTRLTGPGVRERDDVHFGGSFLEFGTYGLLAAVRLFGAECVMNMEPVFHVQRDERGVDIYAKAYLNGEEAFATVKTGLGVKSEGQLLVSGTQGYILVPAPWWLTSRFEVHHEDPDDIQVFEEPYLGVGLRNVLSNFIQLVRGEGDVRPKMAPEESVAMATVIQSYLKTAAR